MSRTRLGQSPTCPSLAIARCPGVLVETCFRPYCAHSGVRAQKRPDQCPATRSTGLPPWGSCCGRADPALVIRRTPAGTLPRRPDRSGTLSRMWEGHGRSQGLVRAGSRDRDGFLQTSPDSSRALRELERGRGVECPTIVSISATATGISPAVVNSKRSATLRQSVEPIAWRVASIASCGGKAGFSGNGETELATVTSNDILRT
jgi:hypothetical protein